jgi:hypothetical protein
MRRGPEDPQADFAGGVAAQDWAVLYEKYPNTLASSGDGAADSGEPSPRNDEVGGETDCRERAGPVGTQGFE